MPVSDYGLAAEIAARFGWKLKSHTSTSEEAIHEDRKSSSPKKPRYTFTEEEQAWLSRFSVKTSIPVPADEDGHGWIIEKYCNDEKIVH